MSARRWWSQLHTGPLPADFPRGETMTKRMSDEELADELKDLGPHEGPIKPGDYIRSPYYKDDILCFLQAERAYVQELEKANARLEKRLRLKVAEDELRELRDWDRWSEAIAPLEAEIKQLTAELAEEETK